MSLFNELKRRNVFKVGIAYVIIAWLVAQVLQLVFESFGTPDWVMKTVLVLLATGLPFALFFAWAFEMTPEGLKREHEVDRSQSITSETGRKLDYAIIAVLVVALGYFAYDKFVLSEGRETAAIEIAVEEAASQAAIEQANTEAEVAMEPDRSIAVLPFADMSADKDQEYLSDGLSEELLNLLAKIPELRVTSRSSAFSYKGKKFKITDVGRELNVAHVLEGSVRKAGNQVRITAQLIEVEGDTHLWSQTYDRTLENIFAIQDEIASEVVAQLKVTLLGAALTVQETDPEAYALYLQAGHLRRQDTPETLRRATELYQQALEIAPEYPAAWVGLSSAYQNQAISGQRGFDEGFQLAHEAAEKALALDSDFALAHARLGVLATFSNKLAEAAQHYTRALELDPGNPDVLGGAVVLAQSLGRMDETITMQKYLVARDPVDAGGHQSIGTSYLLAGQLDEAINSLRTALTLSPGRISAHYRIGTALLLKGQAEEALAEFEQEQGDEEYRIKGMAMALHDLDRQQDFQKVFSELRERWGEQWPSEIAHVYAWIGDADSAFEWLDKAVAQNEDGLTQQFQQEFYKPLYDDPRWAEFREKSGSSEAQLAAIEFKVSLPQ